jgi:hypothetical protein
MNMGKIMAEYIGTITIRDPEGGGEVGRGKDAYSLGKRKGRGNRKKNTVFQYV